MLPFLKILMILGIFLFLIYPLCPWPRFLRKISTFRALRYDPPDNKKNFPFIILAILCWIVFVLLHTLLDALCKFLSGLPFVTKIFLETQKALGAYGQFTVEVLFRILLFNAVAIYGFLIAKTFFKLALFNPIFKGKKRVKQAIEEAEEKKKQEEEEARKKKEAENTDDSEVPVLVHTDDEEKPDENTEESVTEKYSFGENIKNSILNLFFVGPDHVYARNWVIRAGSLLQLFIYGVEVIYGLVFLGFIIAIFFPLPTFFYHIFNFFIHRMSLYPFICMLFLQEICNTLRTENPNAKKKAEKEDKEEKKDRFSVALNRLRTKLFRRFGKIHEIRCFPAPKRKDVVDYSFANKTYTCALQFIENRMKNETGYAVQSYLRGLDSAFNEKNVYFGASFYSQLGEYLIAYTYVRLLSGERMIFVTSDKKKAEGLKTYIGKRLSTLTGISEQQSWRIRIAANASRLEQCDVLIATPEDFLDEDLALAFAFSSFALALASSALASASSSASCTVIACVKK